MKERRCIASGETKSAEELIRFVCDPDGMAVPDLAGKLPGRGCWLNATPEDVKKACDKQLFKRHIDAKAPSSEDMLALLSRLYTDRFQQKLAMARRAGLAIGGGGRLASYEMMDGMLIAKDASRRESRGHQNRLQPEWVCEGFDSHFLGHPFGRESLAYIGILPDTSRGTNGLNLQIKQYIERFRPFLTPLACQEGSAGCITPNKIEDSEKL